MFPNQRTNNIFPLMATCHESFDFTLNIHSYIFIFAFRYSSFVHPFLFILTSPCVCFLPFRILTTPILLSRERRPERDVTTQMERLCRRLKSSVHGYAHIFERKNLNGSWDPHFIYMCKFVKGKVVLTRLQSCNL